jgi:hypothetical protein
MRLVVGLLVAATAATALGVGPVGAQSSGGKDTKATKAAPSWKPGDCFAKANVDTDFVDLASKVPCTKPHTVQVTAGAPLPATALEWGITRLRNPKEPIRPWLEQFELSACAPANTAPTIYPKGGAAVAAALAPVKAKYIIPGMGRFGWVLPDDASWNAGARDFLCTFEPDPGREGANRSDIRALETSSPLLGLRYCSDGDGEEIPCSKPHDVQGLLFFAVDTTGLPRPVTNWSDVEYAPFDRACQQIAAALTKADLSGVTVRANADPAGVDPDGFQQITCVAFMTDETMLLPGGTILGRGPKKITPVPAAKAGK